MAGQSGFKWRSTANLGAPPAVGETEDLEAETGTVVAAVTEGIDLLIETDLGTVTDDQGRQISLEVIFALCWLNNYVTCRRREDSLDRGRDRRDRDRDPRDRDRGRDRDRDQDRDTKYECMCLICNL